MSKGPQTVSAGFFYALEKIAIFGKNKLTNRKMAKLKHKYIKPKRVKKTDIHVVSCCSCTKTAVKLFNINMAVDVDFQ